MEEQFWSKLVEFGIVHEGYQGVFVENIKDMCGGMLEHTLSWQVD
jgi:hypothetical protein